MEEYDCYACHGLLVGSPVDALAAWLNAHTPTGIHFQIVGGEDPQVEEGAIRDRIENGLRARRKLIFVGHSKGAMLAYYLAYQAALIVAIDPTGWGSNIDAPEWDLAPPRPGQWLAPRSVTRFINFHQSGAPGGGVLANPGPGREDHFFPDSNHLAIPTDPRTMRIIRDAVVGAMS